mmetsp:Transcript_4844/g.9890  ORF Transcript_4844/g.9890 Transcript_4844/m.9890 type:complete len:258 (+) Transcript_4844:80-853(+)
MADEADLDMAHGKAATFQDLCHNPYSGEKLGEQSAERDRVANELYERNLLELNRIMNGHRHMWMIRLTSVGSIEEASKCRVSDKPGWGCFTIFMPGPGDTPRFGHPNMLNESQLTIYEIMKKDAATIATAQERVHVAQQAGNLTPEEAKKTLAGLEARFRQLPPSATALAEARAREEEEKASAVLGEERAALEAAMQEDEAVMPSFEDLLHSLKEEEADRRPAIAETASTPEESQGLSKSQRRRRNRKANAGFIDER